MKLPESKNTIPAAGGATENRYHEGELVSERVHPYRKLKVIRYSHRVYYCRILAQPELDDLTLTEREIMRS